MTCITLKQISKKYKKNQEFQQKPIKYISGGSIFTGNNIQMFVYVTYLKKKDDIKAIADIFTYHFTEASNN